MLPATMGIMSSTFNGRERATAFAAWGAVMGAAVAFGPLLGGFLTTNYSWRWAFRINVIVAPARDRRRAAVHARAPAIGATRAHRRPGRAAHRVGHVHARLRHQRGRDLRLVAADEGAHDRRRRRSGRRRCRSRSCRSRSCSRPACSSPSTACSATRNAPHADPLFEFSNLRAARVPLRHDHAAAPGDGPGRVPARDVGGAAGRSAPLARSTPASGSCRRALHRRRLAGRQLADPPHRHDQRRAGRPRASRPPGSAVVRRRSTRRHRRSSRCCPASSSSASASASRARSSTT